jgi:hypothetical protein
VGSSTSRRPPKRRGKTRRLPPVSGHIDPTAFGTQHSGYTIEGRIEAIGQLARGANRASKAQWRYVNRLFVVTIAALAVLFVVIFAASRIF